jgi:outer membrane protein assembly factor BamB
MAMMHASVRSSRVGVLCRFAVLLTLISLYMGTPVSVASVAFPGSQLWAKPYNGPGNLDDRASAIGVSPDGSTVFVTGESTGSTSGGDYATVAYNASTGAKLWVQRYNGSGSGPDYASALGVSPEGSAVFVTGAAYGSRNGEDYVTVAYDASTGAKLWMARYNGRADGDDFAYAIGVSPDGSSLFVTGYSVGSTSYYDYATVAYDASTGAKLWVKRYNGRANGYDVAVALGVSADGSKVFVTGRSTGSSSNWDYTTIAYALTGARLWTRRYNGPGSDYDYVHSIQGSPDGAMVFVTGESIGSTSVDYATVAYDASTGATLWGKRYRRGSGYALGVSPDGSTVFVTGVRGVGYATVAYNASTGVKLWATRYNGPANDADIAHAVGVSPDGSTVFVTGESYESTSGYDYATVAYDASSGAELWAKRYDGPTNGDDYARVLAVSPDGTKMFVTGESVTSTSGVDYLTVAYDI